MRDNAMVNWAEYYGTVHLPRLYANAKGFKDEVYRKWMDNLGRFAMSSEKEMAREAVRRIDYIEQHLLNGEKA